MTAAVLNTVGLVLGILGVVVIYEWGPPQPNYELDRYIRLEQSVAISQEELALLKEKAVARSMSAIGLGLIGLGFVFQLAAVWIPYLN
jgi:hypothetical protein